MKYSELLKYGTDLSLENNKEDSAVKILLLDVSKMESHILIGSMNEEVPQDIEDKFKEKLDKYIFSNIPVQHLTGTEYFYGYEFYVNDDVLIPRFETEELVSNILYTYDEVFEGESIKVVDVGTGSGAIAITLDLEEANMTVKATDISDVALDVARKNNDKLKANVEFICGDMLEPLYGEKYDILVSNPPYIPSTEAVDSLVLDNEPHLALFGGEDGLKFYRIILENAHKILNEKSILAFEHAYDKGKEMVDLSKKYFPNSEVRLLKDLQGKDRMTIIINRR
ncbi:peptide chain release factor N(5)-glutamine methyltransferase [Mycoplasmatota bacterium WC44]